MGKVLALRAQTRAAAPAEATSLVDEAYQALKTAIRDNVFPPGHQAAEPEIARQLGMSRTPVHEAIIRLQEEGLVQVLPRRGILICPISADDIREIYDVLIAVEGMAAALLAGLPETLPRRPPKRSSGRRRDGAGSGAGQLLDWAAADERFHQLLTERCGNRRLARVAATVRDQSHRARLFTLHLRPLPTASAAEHRRITDAIRGGAAAEAETAARAHRIRARDALLPLLAQYGMRNL